MTLKQKLLCALMVGAFCATAAGMDEIAAPGKIYQVCSAKQLSDCAAAPKVLRAPDPEYSEEARSNQIQGTVVMMIVVGADGLVKQYKIEKSLGYGLDEQALKALQQWEFQPATVDGKAVAVQIEVQMTFRIYQGPRRGPEKIIRPRP